MTFTTSAHHRSPVKPAGYSDRDAARGFGGLKEHCAAINEAANTVLSMCQSQEVETSATESTSSRRPSIDTGTSLNTGSIIFRQAAASPYNHFLKEYGGQMSQDKCNISAAMIHRLFRFTVILMFLSNVAHTTSKVYNDPIATMSFIPPSTVVLFISLGFQSLATTVDTIANVLTNPLSDVEAGRRRERNVGSLLTVASKWFTAAVPMVFLLGIGLLALELRVLIPKLFQAFAVGGVGN